MPQGLAIPGKPLGRRAHPLWTGDARDPLSADLDEVAGRVSRTALVVDEHAVDRAVARPAVDRDDRDAGGAQRLETRRSRGRHRDHHTRHALRDRHIDVVGFLAEVLVGVAQHHPEPVLATPVLDAADDRREERVLDVGDDHGPDVGRLETERSGRTERLVPELGDRSSHAAARSAETSRVPFSTLDTVAGETCAALATSSIVVARLDTVASIGALGLRS